MTKKKPASKAEKPNHEVSVPAPVVDSWKGPAVAKADGIFHRLLDRFEPKSIVARAKAKADSRKIEAESEVRVEIIREQGKLALQDIRERAAARVLSSQIREQQNIEAVIGATYAALPRGRVQVAAEPVGEDFIHRLFDDCKNIGDFEMQTLWGRILAGEIVRPGSFHPKTLGIVKDLTKEDANLFVKLCSFGIKIEEDFRIIIFDNNASIYKEHGLSYDALCHLDDLGLMRLSSVDLHVDQLPQTFMLHYGEAQFVSDMPPGHTRMEIGTVLLSAAGLQLAPLSHADPVPGFAEYAIAKWKKSGIAFTPVEE